MALKECHWDYGIDEVDLSTTQFWVQLHGIPPSIASMLNISLISRHMRSLLEIEPIPFGVACTKFVRIEWNLMYHNLSKLVFYPTIHESRATIHESRVFHPSLLK